ncbi:AfsR/SARP family transcriptional regulator [Kribbella speibonae]|uniref:Tetratricopeptide repeat protein n=1 Tax=Kribbella speibonae TaxID=1572660 RepID=A0A4R0IP71_9ACTN|nr:AfsR/SARP family transcriptional regulator [Kribbella speibonae]TCC33166.1 tetratricopeptide repeat protein [Kribbella speibonae]
MVGDGVEIRVLGPVEVMVGGRPASLGGQRAHQVLAALLMEAGRAVSADELIDAVWDESPPASARTQLSIQVSTLRRAFADAGCERELIETTPHGYRLNDQEVRIDLAEAERLQAEAQAAGDLEDAADRLRAALALWRGTALRDLSTRALSASAQRVAELRLTIAEQLYDVEFALGRYRQAIAELSALVAEQPLREHLRALLMTALWRSGRPAEALECYREGRDLLVEELGIEPGQELRDLERAVLAGTIPNEPRDEPRAVVPAELPLGVPGFVGRGAAIGRLREVLGGVRVRPAPIAALAGPGGVGKSELAVHVGHLVADAFPDGQLYVDLRGSTPDVAPLEPAEVLGRFLRSLGAADGTVPADTDEAAARFRSMTNDLRLLVVLDNALDVSQVEPLIPAGPECRTIVTSRRILAALTGAVHEPLEVLPEEDAIALLARLVQRVDLADPEQRQAAANVVRLCGALPLAVSIAASRLTSRPSWTLPTLADRLATTDHGSRRLSELQTEDRGVRASFQVSYQELDDRQQRLFRQINLLDAADVGIPVAAALANTSTSTAEDLLESLVDMQLLDSHAPGRYRAHDLLRLFGRDRARATDDDASRAAAVWRALHCYLATARTACRLLNADAAWRTEAGPATLPGVGVELRDRDEVYAWLDAEADNLSAIVRQAAGMDPGLSAAIGSAVGLGLTLRGRHRDRLRLGELVLAAAVEPFHTAVAHENIGAALLRWGDNSFALEHLSRALSAYREIGNEAGQAVQLASMASAYRLLGRHDESIAHSRAAIELNRRNDRPTALADSLTSLGLTYRHADRPADEVAAHTEALAIAESLDEMNWLANILCNLAEATRLAGRPAEALAHFERAHAASRRSEATQTLLDAEIWWGLGRTQADLGAAGTARDCWRRSAGILHELGLISAAERREIARSDTPAAPDLIDRNT